MAFSQIESIYPVTLDYNMQDHQNTAKETFVHMKLAQAINY